ncbi:MAG TPA: HNH endonuclease signature motif containing protein [Candidatus Paceibacterota bacterium]|nr:HNH endonuclease signature motif containing protein [Candidatus Paceibacterota bacterium]
MIKGKEYECLNCKEGFQSKNKDPKFCSKRCAAIYNNSKRVLSIRTKEKIRLGLEKYYKKKGNNGISKIKTCLNCGREFTADKKTRKYCCNECRYDARRFRQKGKLSVRTFHKILGRAFPVWKCPFCDWEKTYHVHHIVSKKNGGDEKTMNLVLLCPNHHSEVHLGGENSSIKKDDLVKYAIGNYYIAEELMEKFYYGSVAKKFELVKN